MALTPAQIALLDSIRTEWNQAEEDIKLAEQVCNNVVVPAIKELRYAGRRLADILYYVTTDADEEKVHELLVDARFDCHRARHDAIDAATAKIAIQFEIMVDKLQHEVILAVFPTFPALVQDLQSIRKKIAKSRKNRENREAIYTSVEAADFPALVTSYTQLLASEAIMKGMAKRNRARDFFGKWGFIVGVAAFIFALITFAITLL